MPRAPFQVLVLPYRRTAHGWRYALFYRADEPCWQGIAGGGEAGEEPLQAARREAREEAGIGDAAFVRLQTVTSIPVVAVPGGTWGPDLHVIPEYAFAVAVASDELVLSPEHIQAGWFAYDEARDRLRYDGNRTALWELDRRLRRHADARDAEECGCAS